jgi:mono/diheme cytochrome c family protein
MSPRTWWVFIAVGGGIAGSLYYFRTHNIGPVERGARVAHAVGCFTCHGAGGAHGIPDPGHALGDVPTWNGGLLTMYVDNEGEIAEWILDGMPARIRKDKDQQRARAGAKILMPAFRSALSASEARDLVAYVKAVAGYGKPEDLKAAEGMELAEKTGCFGCHGPEGRGNPENPRSLKGYIPSWSGRDFPDLAQNDAEIRDWILKGGTPRLESNGLARFFLGRQVLSMPAYDGALKPDEVDRVLDYIHWLRRNPD